MIRLLRTPDQVRRFAKSSKAGGRSLGLVPTMGYLHEGHLSLIRRAKRENNTVVVSIFVNPAQFGPKEDFKKYPRNLKRDKRLAKEAGADAIFYPSAKKMYPAGYSTYVDLTGITDKLCGRSRPGHFKGVATVVTKLFNAASPDIAYFGQKDAQQAIVVKRMARDLDMGLKIRVMPIVREADGLAMSSRNKYLSKDQRCDAAVLYESLMLAKKLIKSGERNADKIRSIIKKRIRSKGFARIDYISIVNTEDLKDVKKIKKGTMIALAVRIGRTRLIDNIII